MALKNFRRIDRKGEFTDRICARDGPQNNNSQTARLKIL